VYKRQSQISAFILGKMKETAEAFLGQTVTLMMRHVNPPNGFMFSRRAADGVDSSASVRVTLRSFWSAAGRGFGSSQRDIDFTLDSMVTTNVPN